MTVGIILERSRLTSQGFILYPGVINWYSKEEIKVMAIMKEEMLLEAETIIAQLLIFIYIKVKAIPGEGTGAFWSTGNHVLEPIHKLIVQMIGVDIDELVDMRAHVSILS